MKRLAFLLAAGIMACVPTFAADAPKVPLAFSSTAPGNVFTAESGAVTLAITGEPATGGAITLTGERGQALGTVAVPAGAASVAVPLSRKGYYLLTADIATATGHEKAVATAAVIGPPIPAGLLAHSPFGLESVSGDRQMGLLAGSAWDRGFTPQNGIVRAGDDVAWWPGYHGKAPTDVPANYVSAVMSPPGWVVAPENSAKESINTTYPPVDWDAYAKIVRLFASSQSWVTHFEALNEPDAYHWKGTDADLVRYHKAIRDGLAAVGHGQKLLGPCFWSIDLQHLDKLVKLGLLDSIDGISMHSYANAPPEGKWIDGIEDLKRYLASVGHPNEPIYLTEFGWDIGNGDKVTPEKELQQARYASRGIVLLAREHLAAATYFALRWTDGVTGPNWSVLRPDNTPRPGYAAIATAYRWLTGCEGGTLLHPTPSSYLILFSKAGKTVGVAWDTVESSRFQLPGKPTRVEGMTGEPVVVDAGGHVTLTQSPLYFESPERALASPDELKPTRVLRGSALSLPKAYAGVAAAGPLNVSINGVSAPADAQPGTYYVIARSGPFWVAQPVAVEPLWSVTAARIVWPKGADDPSVALTLHAASTPAQVTPLLRLQDRPDEFGMSVSVSPQKDVEARIPLHGYAPGSVIAGSAVLEGRTQGRLDSTAFPFRAQPIPCDTLATDDAPISWDSVRAVVSDGWRGFGAAGATQIAPTDCSATVRAVATPSALTVRIDVRDDVWYSGEPGAPLWATDSVQIAFDTTVLGSHQPREIEYAVAGRGGEGLVARDRSTIDALPADASDKRIVADVRRIGDVTRYDVSFPWPTLGLAARPAPTDRIALDIAVNDSDGKGLPRHGLEMTDGIVATKETAGFATLVLR